MRSGKAHLRLGQHPQPLDLNDDALLDQRVLGEGRPQRRRLPRVPAERGRGCRHTGVGWDARTTAASAPRSVSHNRTRLPSIADTAVNEVSGSTGGRALVESARRVAAALLRSGSTPQEVQRVASMVLVTSLLVENDLVRTCYIHPPPRAPPPPPPPHSGRNANCPRCFPAASPTPCTPRAST